MGSGDNEWCNVYDAEGGIGKHLKAACRNLASIGRDSRIYSLQYINNSEFGRKLIMG